MSVGPNNRSIQSIQNILHGIHEMHPCFFQRQLWEQYIDKYGMQLCQSTNYHCGHFTGSSIIVSSKYDCVLLIYHPAFQKWIQPGGHLELHETIQETILREIYEETKTTREFLQPLMVQDDFLTYLHRFDVPKNTSKQRPEHQHFDICLFYEYTGNIKNDHFSNLSCSTTSNMQKKWFPTSDIRTIPTDDATKDLLYFLHSYLE